MYPRSENNLQPYIFFEVQSSGRRNIATFLDHSLPAPSIFTGRPLRGTLIISHGESQEHVFDFVQLTLQGMERGFAYITTERLMIV